MTTTFPYAPEKQLSIFRKQGKVLQRELGDQVKLSQTLDLVAKINAFNSWHDLQTNLKKTPAEDDNYPFPSSDCQPFIVIQTEIVWQCVPGLSMEQARKVISHYMSFYDIHEEMGRQVTKIAHRMFPAHATTNADLLDVMGRVLTTVLVNLHTVTICDEEVLGFSKKYYNQIAQVRIEGKCFPFTAGTLISVNEFQSLGEHLHKVSFHKRYPLITAKELDVHICEQMLVVISQLSRGKELYSSDVLMAPNYAEVWVQVDALFAAMERHLMSLPDVNSRHSFLVKDNEKRPALHSMISSGLLRMGLLTPAHFNIQAFIGQYGETLNTRNLFRLSVDRFKNIAPDLMAEFMQVPTCKEKCAQMFYEEGQQIQR